MPHLAKRAPALGMGQQLQYGIDKAVVGIVTRGLLGLCFARVCGFNGCRFKTSVFDASL